MPPGMIDIDYSNAGPFDAGAEDSARGLLADLLLRNRRRAPGATPPFLPARNAPRAFPATASGASAGPSAPAYGPLTQQEAARPEAGTLQQLRYEYEHPVEPTQPHGLKAFGEGLLNVVLPRAEQFIQQRRYAPAFAQENRIAELEREAQLLTPQQHPLQDVTKKYSDALATGNTAEAERLAPLVEKYESTVAKPRSEKPGSPQEQAYKYLLTTKNPMTGKNLTPQEAYEALQRPSTQQPNELTLWLKAHPDKTIDDYMRVQASLKPEFPRIQPVNDAQGNLVGYATFTGTAAGVIPGFVPAGAIPGLAKTLGANVIPPKPTSTTLTMSQMAKTVLPQIEQLDRQIDETASALGPLAGRWNEVMVGKVGADNPKVAALLSNIDAMASALTRTHFGARGGQEYIQALRKSLRLAQSPADLKARLAAWATWVNAYASMTGGAQPSAKPSTQGAKDFGPAGGKTEGSTGTLPDGTRVVVRGGRIVAE